MSEKRILIVEDDQLVAATYCEILQDQYQTEIAADAAKAMERAVTDPPDLIILDLRLPEIDGYQLARYFRIQPATANVPILVLSAHITKETEPRLESLGRIGVKSKPVEAEELKQTIYAMMQL